MNGTIEPTTSETTELENQSANKTNRTNSSNRIMKLLDQFADGTTRALLFLRGQMYTSGRTLKNPFVCLNITMPRLYIITLSLIKAV